MNLDPQTIFDGAMFLLVVGGIFASYQVAKSTNKTAVESEALNTIKLKDERISELTKKITNLEETVVQDGKQIAILNADRDRLEKIVANYNPQLEGFIEAATKSLTNIAETNKIILESIHLLLKSQTPTVTVNNQPA